MTTTVTMSGPGSTVIVDDAALAITTAAASITAAIAAATAAQTTAQQAIWGAPGGKIPGTGAALLSGLVMAQQQTNANLTTLLAKLNETNTALAKVSQSIEHVVEGSASISYNLNKIVTTQQLAAADQIKNNKFQQTTTNNALIDAGKPATEVPPAAMQAQVKGAVKDIASIKTEVGTATLLEQGVDEAAQQAKKMAEKLLGQPFTDWIKSTWDSFVAAKIFTSPTGPAKAVADQTDRKLISVNTLTPPPSQDLVSATTIST
jgi:hypothetical protein